MPFIDNDLLWSSDHDGKMVDISSCLQDASVAVGQQNIAQGGGGAALGELSQSDLSSLVPSASEGQMNDDDIFKHLSDTAAIEIDSLLNEFNATPYIKQEENNNIPNSCTDNDVSSSHGHQKSAVSIEMRSLKFTIAAANPILAEKLSTPSEQSQQLQDGDTRPQLALLTPKIEKDPLRHREIQSQLSYLEKRNSESFFSRFPVMLLNEVANVAGRQTSEPDTPDMVLPKSIGIRSVIKGQVWRSWHEVRTQFHKLRA
ncbi:hypothetical protein WA026_007597 [Henosepilachna vigintioctopunctata]|uniref:Uncharacterized protein n=1 Tax=Henosepilachna vigintioctopunctata TaxID=420089 RepID=A0AAW1UW80_9CUCU